MPEGRTDIVTLLKKEREYHLDQVKRINLALSALTDDTPTTEPLTPKPRSIGWAAAIDQIFENTDEWLDLQQIREKMAETGLPEALEDKNRNTVYSTLIRKASKTKTLEKSDDGKYRKRIESQENEEPEKPVRKIRRRKKPDSSQLDFGDNDEPEKEKAREPDDPLAQ